MSDDRIFKEYYERVLIFVRIKINYHPDAEELTQEILTSFTASLKKGLSLQKESPWPYLYGVCSNKIKDWYKSRQNDQRYDSLEERQTVDPAPEALEKIIRIEERKNIDAALRRLKHNEQRILYMRYYQEMSYEEIAILLNMKTAAVRKAAQRARNKMREHLKKVFVTFVVLWLLFNGSLLPGKY